MKRRRTKGSLNIPEELGKAINLHQNGHLQQAKVKYQKILRHSPKHPEALHMLGILHSQEGVFDKAIDLMRKSIKHAPGRSDYLFNFARVCHDGGRLKEAIAVYQEYSSRVPDDAEAFYWAGRAHEETQDLEQAIVCFGRALERFPGRVDFLNSMGLAHNSMGNYEKAVKYYERALQHQPNDLIVLQNLGNAYSGLRNFDKAIDLYLKGLSLEPSNTSILNNLGWLYFEKDDFEKASSYYEKALHSQPNHHIALLNKGVFLNFEGKVKEAARCFEKALSVEFDFPQAQTYLAISSWINGDWKGCRKYIDEIFESKTPLSLFEKRFVRPYSRFLDELLRYRETHASEYVKKENLQTLYVVGDSHCLPAANQRVVFKGGNYNTELKIVIGCKAWHLGNNDKNKYICEFENKIEQIPDGSIVLLMFGEIDCRIQEGIIKNYKKTNGNLTESISSVINSYIDQINNAFSSRNLNIVICNVPLVTDEKGMDYESDVRLKEKVVDIYNNKLKERLTKEDLAMLDVYSPSKEHRSDEGKDFFIDNIHLKPSVIVNLISTIE